MSLLLLFNPAEGGVTLQAIALNADVTTTGWTNELGGTTNLYASIDEETLDTADYVTATFA